MQGVLALFFRDGRPSKTGASATLAVPHLQKERDIMDAEIRLINAVPIEKSLQNVIDAAAMEGRSGAGRSGLT